MGKLIITAQMSADASIGPNIGWFEGGEHQYAAENEVRLAGAMLLGRKTYESLSAIWPGMSGEFADMVNSLPKHVASTSLVEPLDWNATLIKGDLADEVRRLKAEYETLVSHGCGKLAFELVKQGLADEVHFWVHPVIWSEPDQPFHGLGHVRMKLKDAAVFRNGVTLQNYEPMSVEE